MTLSKMTIVGGGLIGCSMAAGLKRKMRALSINCVDLPDAQGEIERTGVFDSVTTFQEGYSCLKNSRVVVLAAGVDSNLGLLDEISPHLEAGTIVTDVGSCKLEITRRAREVLPPHIHFVGGHPVAGSERSGAAAADPFLFENKPYILCPNPDTDESVFLALIDLVEELGAIPITMESAEHDRVLATVSHAPQMIAVALMHSARKQDMSHGVLDLVAGGGFMDMTRIASSSLDVWRGILLSNRKAVALALDNFEESLKELREALENDHISSVWEPVRRRRREMEPREPNRDCERDLRNSVDALDAQLLKVVGRRQKVVEKIGAAKSKKGLPVLDARREKLVKERWTKHGEIFDLSPELINDLFSVVTDHAKRVQGR